MHLAIIPARGGSKRIPGKNIRLMNGKPLIAWTIEACTKSGLFDHILVSTDCEKIAKTAKKFGAEVPFLRPQNLADDYTPTKPVIDHALDWTKNHWGKPAYYCQLYANPFITIENLQKGYTLLKKSEVSQVSVVAEFPHPILRGLKLEKEELVYAFPEYREYRSQDLPTFFYDAGQFYWRNPTATHKKMLPLIINRLNAVDIDTLDDWNIAEFLLKNLNSFEK